MRLIQTYTNNGDKEILIGHILGAKRQLKSYSQQNCILKGEKKDILFKNISILSSGEHLLLYTLSCLGGGGAETIWTQKQQKSPKPAPETETLLPCASLHQASL